MVEDIINILKRAGDEVLEIYQRNYTIQKKEDRSSVTEADLVSEKIILDGLKKYDYDVTSEESDLPYLNKQRRWVIDPLDGTEDFLHKTGQFSLMVGLVDREEPVLGVVYLPTEEKVYFAQKGKGAYMRQANGDIKRLKVSDVSELKNACLVTSRFHLDKETQEFAKNKGVNKTKPTGSIGIKLGLIAEAKADIYLTYSNKTCQWDTCAPEVILKEAGGRITDLKGADLLYKKSEIKNINGVLATNGKLHKII